MEFDTDSDGDLLTIPSSNSSSSSDDSHFLVVALACIVAYEHETSREPPII